MTTILHLLSVQLVEGGILIVSVLAVAVAIGSVVLVCNLDKVIGWFFVSVLNKLEKATK